MGVSVAAVELVRWDSTCAEEQPLDLIKITYVLPTDERIRTITLYDETLLGARDWFERSFIVNKKHPAHIISIAPVDPPPAEAPPATAPPP